MRHLVVIKTFVNAFRFVCSLTLHAVRGNSKAVLRCLSHVAGAYVQRPYQDNVLFYSVSEYATGGGNCIVLCCASADYPIQGWPKYDPRDECGPREESICGPWSRE